MGLVAGHGGVEMSDKEVEEGGDKEAGNKVEGETGDLGGLENGCWYVEYHCRKIREVSLQLCACDLENLHTVTFGFQRNPDVARNRRLGGQEHVRLIAIDYHTVAGTAGAECKGDQRSKRARRSESRTDSNGLMETQE